MRKVIRTPKFVKDITCMYKRGENLKLLENLIKRIKFRNLSKKDKDHHLKGDFLGYRECHVKGNWIVVYRELDEHTIELYRTGSHSDIFKKKY